MKLFQRASPVEIVPRDLKFNRTVVDGDRAGLRWWHNNDPVRTAFFNALSVTFPLGESLFIQAVRTHMDAASPELRLEIKAFINQERMHMREHEFFNRLIERSGYDISKMTEYTAQQVAIVRSRPPIEQLAITVVLEHFTAILSHALLANPRHLAGTPPEIASLWRYHAIEELEHKSVAFDTYVAATKQWSPFKRWRFRCKVMLIGSVLFWWSNTRHIADFLRQDGINTSLSWLRLLKQHFIVPGLLRQAFIHYWRFYLPSFHPWDTDDRDLIAAADALLRVRSTGNDV